MNAPFLSAIRCTPVRRLIEHTVSWPSQSLAKVRFVLCSSLLVLTVATSVQGADTEKNIKLTENDARFRVVTVMDEQLLLHLKNGHERIIAFPETVKLAPNQSTLPDCDIALDQNVVAFYPARTFERIRLKLIGLKTGTIYELGVRSSADGLTQPLKLVR